MAEDPTEPTARATSGARPGGGGPYANYVLAVLVLVYVFNFLDRQIVSILAERIKASLDLTDDQLGFLYGTAFAVFYAIFGIPLGRLADVWNRKGLIALGLAFWSLMTAASGLARNFLQLAAARVGVGVGEASASPAAFSMLSDYFPVSRRATVLAIYSSGIYLGAGLGLGVGGVIVDQWNSAWAETTPPFGLMGWQVAFFAVGLPGLILALWVATLREPARGEADGILTPPEPHPFRQFFLELRSVLPPLTVLHLWWAGAGVRGLTNNLLGALVIALVSAGLIAVTSSTAQWIALGIGVYAAFSWMQALRLRDNVAFQLIFKTRSLVYACLGFSFLAFAGYGIGFWMPPFFIRGHAVGEAQVGFVLGGTSALGGWIGIIAGGILADRWRRTTPRGRIYTGILTGLLPAIFVVGLLTTPSVIVAYTLSFPISLLSSMWIGPGASTVQDLVLPRMRASASAVYLLLVTFIGLALGPYSIGYASRMLGSLQLAMLLLGIGAGGVAALLLWRAGRHVTDDEATLFDRARAAGEKGI